MTDRELVLSALKESELFAGADISSCTGRMIKAFKRGEEISEVQNGFDCVGVILSGSASVSSEGGGTVSISRAGTEFGICNIFVSESMPTILKARVQTKVLFIPKDEFAALLAADSSLMYRYVKLCNEKMVYLAKKLRLFSVTGSLARLAVWLEMNAKEKEARIVSKDELARQLCISRASLFRAIARLEAQGIITTSGERIIISNNEALEAVIGNN
ncbi:MAG: Crp/Fnr family transcriptional regulator [Oscillospiraceae bacterium]|nr:Crp/Fnr family transcriptional regulator [Oscillospiraceae bacterium]